MTDREQVIKGLEHCRDRDYSCEDCPYAKEWHRSVAECLWERVNDALALLKEQKAAKPSSGEWLWDRPHHFRCSVCEKVDGVTATMWKYCPHCGSMMFLSEMERRKEWGDA